MPGRKNKRIGVWIDASTHIGRGVIGGIVEAARLHRWRLTYDRIDIDGGITDATDAFPKDLAAVRVLTSDPERPSVSSDENAIAAMALEHFQARGFRHFVFIGDDKAVASRGDAFAMIVEKSAQKYRDDKPTFAHEDAAQTFSDAELGNWLRTLPAPLACFCAHDTLAERVARGISTMPQHSIAVLGVGDDPAVCEFAEMTLSSIDPNAREIGRRAVELLAGYFNRKHTRTVLVPPCRVVERASTDMVAIDDAEILATVQFIRAHAASPIGIADIIRVAKLPRRTLERRFGKLMYCSPVEFLRRQRIILVKHLLATSDIGIAEIAGQCGFVSPQHLASAFKQTTGHTPSDYRRQFSA